MSHLTYGIENHFIRRNITSHVSTSAVVVTLGTAAPVLRTSTLTWRADSGTCVRVPMRYQYRYPHWSFHAVPVPILHRYLVYSKSWRYKSRRYRYLFSQSQRYWVLCVSVCFKYFTHEYEDQGRVRCSARLEHGFKVFITFPKLNYSYNVTSNGGTSVPVPVPRSRQFSPTSTGTSF